MRRFTCLLVCLFSFVAGAKAAEFRPFVGLSSVTDLVCPLYNLRGYGESGFLPHMFACGTQTEFGADFGNYSLFIGYHFFSSVEEGTHDNSNR